MKGYYIHYRDIRNPVSNMTGSDKKVKAQIAAFNKAGLNCEFLFCPHPEELLPMVKSCLPRCSDGIKWPNPEIMKEVNYLYIRKPRFFSKDFVDFLKRVKQVNPDLLVVCEIPTYPYDKEMMRPKILLAYLKDKKYRFQLNGLIDYFADLSNSNTIFGLPTIPFYNGIDIKSISVREPTSPDDTLNLLAVAYFEFWHGIDRLVKGLKHYYENDGAKNIHVHLVGDGGAISEIKNEVEKYHLQANFSFYGSLMPSEIDPIYAKCQMAVSSLGMHRLDPNIIASSLKSREYLAKGIPFIFSSKIDIFEKYPNDFCLELPATDDPIDINSIINKYDELSSMYSPNDIISLVREYAEGTISMDIAMRDVIEVIRDACS